MHRQTRLWEEYLKSLVIYEHMQGLWATTVSCKLKHNLDFCGKAML